MAATLGTIRGQMILDVKQTLAAYTSARAAHVSTVTALHTGAGALTMVGAGLAAAGVGMAAGIMTAVGAAATFEKRLDYFGAVSASTQAEYDAIREKALQLGTDTIYSANEIADSFIELGKAGVGANDIINGIGEAVANLGSAADIPLDNAAKIIMSAVQTFGLGADKAIGVADKLAGAANASIIDVEDLGVSLKYAGGVAASLGIPFEDVNTALGLLGQYGIRGSTAGTSLRKMLLSLGGATPKATAALKELGIITKDGTNKFFDAEGSAKPLASIFQTLQEATAGLSDKQKVAALNTIFQNRALASAIGLTTEGAAGFEKMSAAIDKTTAMEVAGKRLDNLSGDIEILRGNIDTLLIKSGSSFQSFSRGLIQGITGIVQAFADLPAGVQTGLMIFGSIMAVILIVIGVFGMFAGAVLNMIALAIQLAPVFVAVRTAFLTVGAAFKAFSLLLLANPIGLIIAGIALLVAGLIWFFTQTEVGKTAWKEFTRFLGEAWANIVSVATDTFTNLGNFFSDVWANIVGFFTGAIDFIMGLFFKFHPLGIIIANWGAIMGFFATVWTNITTGITTFIAGVIGYFQALPGRIVAFWTALPGMIGYALGFLLGTIVRAIINIGVWLVTNVPIILNNIVTFFSELPAKVIVFFVNLYNGVNTWFTNLGIQLLVLALRMYLGMIRFFQQLPGKIIAFFSKLYTGATKWLQNMAVKAVVLAIQLYTGIVSWVSKLPQTVANFFVSVVNNVMKFFGQARTQAISIARGIYTGIRDGINGIPGLVTGIFNNVIGAIKNVITSAANAVRDFASGMWEGFKDGLGIHSPSYIEHAMWAITGVLDEETQSMRKQVKTIQGLGNGISEVGNNIGNGFGSNLSGEVSSLYAQMKTMRGFEAQVAVGQAGGSAGVESTQAAAIFDLGETIKGLKDEVGDTHYDIVINNPEPEKASSSLPTSIRKAAYVS